MKKAKILHYTPGFNSGGIESRLLDWYRNIDKSKIEYSLIKLNDNNNTKYICEFKAMGGTVYSLPSINFRNFYKYYKGLNNIIRLENCDILHVHDMNSGFFPLFIAKKNRVKVRIMHSRTTSFLPNEKNKNLKKILKLFICYYANNFLACSKNAAIWAFGKSIGSKAYVVKNGIQLSEYSKSKKMEIVYMSKKNKVIGTVSRLSEQKNLYFLLDIFKEVYSHDKSTILVIVGDGPLKSSLEKKATDLGLKDSVKFVGDKFNVWDYYNSFDVFISTSYYEGFGTTAIEAQASGLPCVLSKGFPDEVKICENVEILPLSLSKEEWVKVVLNKLSNKKEKDAIHKIMSNGYSASLVAKKLENFYLSAIDNERGIGTWD